MYKKLLSLAAIFLMFACIFALSASAATQTVYVKSGASGDGLTSSNPTGSVNTALAALTGDGKVVFLNEVTISSPSTFGSIDYNYTLTAESGGALVLAADLAVGYDTIDNVITFNLPVKISGTSDVALFGGYNNIVFGKSFSVTSSSGGGLHFFGGVDSESRDGIAKRAYSITVNAGTFASFNGGNRRASISARVGSIAAPITITVNGGTFGKNTAYATNNNKNYDAFTISGMSILADDATLKITGGTFYCPIFAQGKLYSLSSSASLDSVTVASDKKYYAIDGDVNINITGGTFNGGLISAYYTQATYTTLMRGNFDVSITGGTFKSGTVIDATQVKAYKGGTEKATITYSGVSNITPKRFDVVNGTEATYTEPTRVVFIGDSITQGYAADAAGVDPLTQSYPAQFLKLCEDAGKEVIVSNFGVAGSGLHPSLTKYYIDKTLAYPMVINETDPTYVFFAIGTNDAAAIGGTTSALKLYEKNLSDFALKMGALPNTKKVFITNAIYRYTTTKNADMRAASVLRPAQKRVAESLSAKNANKYFFVDLYGLTLSAVKDDSLFKADNGGIYERLHPTQTGLALMGKSCYNALYSKVYAPTSDYQLTDIYVSASGNRLGAGTSADPISDLGYAFSLAKEDAEVTIHIVGDYTTDCNWTLPSAPSKVIFTGTGTNPRMGYSNGTTTGTIKFGTATRIEKLTVGTSGSTINMFAAYNDTEIANTIKTEGDISFYAGYNVFGNVDPAGASAHDDTASVSASNDCSVTVNGGTYVNLAFGNGRFAATAPIGTYSGTMKIYVGTTVTCSGDICGINGRNYLTGTLSAQIYGWGTGAVNEYAPIGSLSGIKYDQTKNSGTIKIRRGSGFTNDINYVGDFNSDGVVDVKDVALSLNYYLNGFDSTKKDCYNGQTLKTFIEVLRMLKKSVL